jgi:hypothetical protein
MFDFKGECYLALRRRGLVCDKCLELTCLNFILLFKKIIKNMNMENKVIQDYGKTVQPEIYIRALQGSLILLKYISSTLLVR